MPEGHSIHRAARIQNAALGGKMISSVSPQGRFAREAASLDGRRLRRVEAVGKHLLYHFTVGVVHVHLGMYGGFKAIRRRGEGWPEPSPNARWRLTAPGARVGVDLSGPTACELLDAEAVAELRARLGVDLLGPEAKDRRSEVCERVRAKKTPIGAVLMDQSITSGIGNIYRAELLYRARLDPRTPSNEVSAATFEALYDDAIGLLKVGVRHAKILTVEPAALGKRRWAEVGPGERFWVYGRDTCRGCGGPVEVFKQAGRKVHWCPAEQAA